MGVAVERAADTVRPSENLIADAACYVPRTGDTALRADEAENLAARFKALAVPNRVRILSIISTNAEAETCVCDLSEPLNLSQPTVSHHLKIFVEAGLLHREKRGVWAYYALVPGALETLAGALTASVTMDQPAPPNPPGR